MKAAIAHGDLDALIHYERWGVDGQFGVPSQDHYLPLLWTVALRRPGDDVSFPCQVMQNRSVSMRSVAFGLA